MILQDDVFISLSNYQFSIIHYQLKICPSGRTAHAAATGE
jgi:hypothetical protein